MGDPYACKEYETFKANPETCIHGGITQKCSDCEVSVLDIIIERLNNHNRRLQVETVEMIAKIAELEKRVKKCEMKVIDRLKELQALVPSHCAPIIEEAIEELQRLNRELSWEGPKDGRPD